MVDKETGETIIGVNIIVEGTDFGTATDMSGFFVVTNLSAGDISLLFTHIAYEYKVQRIEIAGADLFLGRVLMTPTAIEGEAVEVVANRGNIIKAETDIASFKVDPKVLQEVPQLGKDVFELVKFSPSVTISDAFSPLYTSAVATPVKISCCWTA